MMQTGGLVLQGLIAGSSMLGMIVHTLFSATAVVSGGFPVLAGAAALCIFPSAPVFAVRG